MTHFFTPEFIYTVQVLFEEDTNGNLTNDGKFRYEWNAFDQLTKVLTTGGNLIAEYRYDDQGRRVFSNTSSGETYYRYNGISNQVLFEEDASGNITKSFTYDDNGNPLTMTYQGATYYFLTNYRGDILALVNKSGDRVATYTYDAWGNILTQSGSEIATINPYRYAGYRYDEDTKLYYLMARYYNPDTGVFLSLDPVRGDIMNPITMNGYSYANNNPVMMIDSDGKSAAAVLGSGLAIPGIGWVSAGIFIAVVGSAWLIAKYGIPWAKNKYKNWYFVSKNIKGWNVRVEEHHGKLHAHWKKGGKKGSVNKDGSAHHKGESTSPPKEIKDFLKQRGFKVK
ncbi:type IV secretion protein Rhs [Sporosarcina sp. P16b]|uniref:RHS repeat domain-containing protein n=1 Tax=Sporosarcina sp. P16b TaxID=2048261 RepID=UPI000C167611|nr:RHS repeat-associated core domain-containing protein [Sporosarcina sp. P16b]PIC69006.1 type IV secretion protein Rhs [Sporosarcina sp. P16b]